MKENMSVHMPAQILWIDISLKCKCSGIKVRICVDLCTKLVEVQSYVYL